MHKRLFIGSFIVEMLFSCGASSLYAQTDSLSLVTGGHKSVLPIAYQASGRIGWVMPDGKVDKLVGQTGDWVGPVGGVDVSATFYPRRSSLRYWNNAGVGVGLSYWYMSHDILGHAIAPYTYMDIPLVHCPHFVLGLRPGAGAAFMTKTYRNTVPYGHLYEDMVDANGCIGSVFNFYFPEAIYMRFPIVRGWSVDVSGGWYHISNGSLRQPNSGYNIFAAEIGVRYAVHDDKRHSDRSSGDTGVDDKPRAWELEASVSGGSRQVYYKDRQSFGVCEMQLAAYWRAHPIFRLGGGVDVFYDGAYINRSTSFEKTNLSAARKGDCWRVGVSLQPEFVVGRFTAGLHIGAYLYDPVKELEPADEAASTASGRLTKPVFYKYDLLKAGSAGYPDGWLYTQVVFRYRLPWHLFVQGAIKSHLTKVEFVSIGVGAGVGN